MDESHLMVYIKLFKHLLRLMTTAVCENAVNRMKLHSVITSQTFYDLLVESGLICVDLERQMIQLLLELALEVSLPPFVTSESVASAEMAESEKASFLVKTPSGQFNPDKQRIYNAGAIRVLIRSLLLFTPKMQLEFLNLLQRLARASPFNQENLTSAGKNYELCLRVPWAQELSQLLNLVLHSCRLYLLMKIIMEQVAWNFCWRLSTPSFRVHLHFFLIF